MTEILTKTDVSSSTAISGLSTLRLPFSLDCSPFLSWNEEKLESEHERIVVFRSLVATVKSQPALDAPLEAKAVKFLEYMRHITTATMGMLNHRIAWCYPKNLLSLVKADLIPQLIGSLNPQSLSFTEADDVHALLLLSIRKFFELATPNGLIYPRINDADGQQAVHETVFRHVLVPSEKYICHLCMNRFSIIDGKQSRFFLFLLARLLKISPYYQPTMDLVLHMPVFLTIPSCLTFFEYDDSIRWFLRLMVDFQLEWNELRGEVRQMGNSVYRAMQMEGIEDVIEEKLRYDQNEYFGRYIVVRSIDWNNLQGMNISQLW
ncbi:hypothetical protein BLNAU_11172 [Blattamonas nauphoetae]|uniref:Uncharacterized protein n=1 Tax=Blattamonas nauphoetae TaxID=2049346 RepID=A0ABQ9XR14_9EUKA|nr:hypothetical protein BLNAU_11172 [Blattamonas nauphoetae]